MRLARSIAIALLLCLATGIITSCQPDPVTVLTSQRALAPDEPPESFEQRFLDYTAAVWYQRTLAFAAAIHYQKVLAFAAAVEAARHPSWQEWPWRQLAECESGGRWDLVTGNGFYGGLQWVPSTFHAYGGVGRPQDASPAEQVRVAERVLAAAGGRFTDWPGCRRKLGLP